MWVSLLIVHGLLAVALLGAVTHQLVSVWVPARATAPARKTPKGIVSRYRGVSSAAYANTIVSLFIITALMGWVLYGHYQLGARTVITEGGYWKTFGVFEIKEHLVAIALGTLPAYWHYWRSPLDEAHARTRAMLTSVLAFVVWWSFLAGHITNNVRGFGA
jgi:hypothetical protein